MFRRELSRDAVLWWKGDPARSVGFLESGRLGIRVEGTLLDALGPGAVVGEAALLPSAAVRAADVVVLEDGAVVVEHDVEELRQAGCTDLHRRVLTSLSGQIARNHLLAAAACPGQPLVEATVTGLLQGLARAEERVSEVADWEGFQVAFRFLFHLRDGSDATRAALAPAGSWSLDAALVLLDDFRTLQGGQQQMAEHLERMLRAESRRIGS